METGKKALLTIFDDPTRVSKSLNGKFLYIKKEGKREDTHDTSTSERLVKVKAAKMRPSFGLGFALTILLLLLPSLGARGVSNGCGKEDIVVAQGQGPTEPNGMPTFVVEISNESAFPISDLHLSCGLFSSAILINPTVFRRLGSDDCLVNDGNPLASGDSLSFKYATSFKYPLSVSSFKCA